MLWEHEEKIERNGALKFADGLWIKWCKVEEVLKTQTQNKKPNDPRTKINRSRLCGHGLCVIGI